jgi:uncharacterized membrane protein
MNSPGDIQMLVVLSVTFYSATCFLVARHRLSGWFLSFPALASYVVVRLWTIQQMLIPTTGADQMATWNSIMFSIVFLVGLTVFWIMVGSAVRQQEK